jgi:hypothetical protein
MTIQVGDHVKIRPHDAQGEEAFYAGHYGVVVKANYEDDEFFVSGGTFSADGTHAPMFSRCEIALTRYVRCNCWGNWYGYERCKRAIAFGNSTTETAEQAAQRWLREKELAEQKR